MQKKQQANHPQHVPINTGLPILIKPCTGVWAGSLAGEVLLLGIAVGSLDEGRSDAPVADRSGNVSVEDVHDPASYYICEISRMTVADNLKATKVLVVFHPCVHCMITLPERNILLQVGGRNQKECRREDGREVIS